MSLGLDSTILVTHFDTDFICSQLHDSIALDLLSDDLIGRISSNYYRVIWSVLFHILSHNLLMISSEDDLFSYISSCISSDAEYLHLLQFVRYEYLSAECISCFFSALPDSIDRRVWESVSRRLISPIAVEFRCKQAKSFDRIIAYLTEKHGGNVYDKGIVTITSKSVLSDGYAVKNVADLAYGSCFHSTSEPGQWVCWDFRELCVRPTHYTIRAGYLKSWVLQSSQDFINWTEIDRKTDNQDFKGYNWTAASFAVSNSAEYPFIRLTQTGKNHRRNYSLSIAAFEVFGALLERRA
jgi:hypothetical protein